MRAEKLLILAAATLLALVGGQLMTHAETFSELCELGVYNNRGWRQDEPAPVASGEWLFGATSNSGSGTGSWGTLFKVKKDGTGLTVLVSRTNTDWKAPNSVIVDGDTIYGTTIYGDTNASGLLIGTVYKVKTDGTDYSVLKVFHDYDGSDPRGGLVLLGSTLYGATSGGGSNRNGTIFRIDTNGANFATIHDFTGFDTNYVNQDGAYPNAQLATDGEYLYGTALYGGAGRLGTVYKLRPNGSGFESLHHFYSGALNGAEGNGPASRLVVRNGVLYGTTQYGGPDDQGVLFKVNADGSGYQLIHTAFSRALAFNFYGDLSVGPNSIYGSSVNYSGGPLGLGTLFKFDFDGENFQVVRIFPDSEGWVPDSGFASDGGKLYGVARAAESFGEMIYRLGLPPVPPVLISPTLQTGIFSFHWSATVGARYRVEYQDPLGSTNWSALGDTLTATNTDCCFAEPAQSSGQRFYRVTALDAP